MAESSKKHLFSGKELELPMQLSDEQIGIVLSPKSSIIMGRSGTGKSRDFTAKLFERMYEVESSGIGNPEVVDGSEESFMRQLYVTTSPRLCDIVKKEILHLKSISCEGSSSTGINLDVKSVLNHIPDKFYDLSKNNYPLVITFQKFLMMLDGTLGNPFFEKFPGVSSGSVELQIFIESSEVTYKRFCEEYWPHFNSKLTQKLDPYRVFTEFVSHIKGGLLAGECRDGKLSKDDYLSLAKDRTSTVIDSTRDTIYTLFEAYEKAKYKRGDFDLGDFVNDIHNRLKNENYEGDLMNYVYIDEVQDLTMQQIALFKYICKDVDEGFTFAGDTAQTIAKGVDFRFEDIRSLFYKEFLTSGKKEKGLVFDIFQLKQNFRTYAAVLQLSQSVIDILYHYFSHSIDKLEPETSHIFGEAPVLLESGNDENPLKTIFSGTGSCGENEGFGAEQVILVRDDVTKKEVSEVLKALKRSHFQKEVSESVEEAALVLTIAECKGLEFQDVLLYNFFGTSPLNNQWRVIYGYMKEQGLYDVKFPIFDETRHSVLCSGLKQLYVAITRTRQRLWICEDKEGLLNPMLDYWKVRELVQIIKLDDSVARDMRVASSPQEWLERGQKNFEMATMCFKRAGDTFWEKFSKASSLRASVDQIRGTDFETSLGYLREATVMFMSIGEVQYAASCHNDMEEYERAAEMMRSLDGALNEADLLEEVGDFKNAAVNEARLFDLLFPLDWRTASSEDVVSLRKTDLSRNLLCEILEQNVGSSGNISYWTIGRVMMICIGSGEKLVIDDVIINGLKWDPTWLSVVKSWNSEFNRGNSLIPLLKKALRDTFNMNWSTDGYLSIHTFVHLLEGLLFSEPCKSMLYLTTVSGYVQWSRNLPRMSESFIDVLSIPSPDLTFYVEAVQKILSSKEDTENWIRGSNIVVADYLPLLVLKLMMMLCIICVKLDSMHSPDLYFEVSDAVFDFLKSKKTMASLLPRKFVDIFLRKRDGRVFVTREIVAEAFASVDDPLVMMSLENNNMLKIGPNAIFVDLNKSQEEVFGILFMKRSIICGKGSSSSLKGKKAATKKKGKKKGNRKGFY